jgi:hypothetical protein
MCDSATDLWMLRDNETVRMRQGTNEPLISFFFCLCFAVHNYFGSSCATVEYE